MIKNLAGRLKELRVQNKLTQKQVSELLGISPSIISGYENAERTPSEEILLSLSYLYKCRTDYIHGKSNDMPAILLDTNGLTPNQINAISALFESIRQ